VAAPEGSVRGAVLIAGVSKHFGGTTAVRSLDLAVHPGEFLSLLGPSGCGKTTTLRMLSGFEVPDTGDIHISGQSVTGLPPHRRDVNTVFQAYALFPHLSVAENVAYGLRQRKVARPEVNQRVTEALEMVRMTALAARRPHQLSGGQQQRVALARALVNRPSVLLLDEPLGALDRKLREDMQIELKLLQSKLGITFVFVTHDQEEALSMSDRVAVMRDGVIEQLGDPYTIYEEPATAFVAGFIGQQNFFDGFAREDGRVIDCPEALLRSTRAVPDGVVNGSAALAAVRPEVISVTQSPSTGAANTVRGVLASVAHLGDSIQFVVAVPGRRELIAKSPRVTAPRIDPGNGVTCLWSEQDVHVFPKSTSEGQQP
jgi:spermidine/putrescine transport system ATP-binding protein